MARKKKRPDLAHCKVRSQKHPTTPWRVSFKADEMGKKVTKRKSFAAEDDAWAFAEAQDLEIKNHGLRFGDIPAEARRAFDFYRDEKAKMEGEGVEVPGIEDLVRNALAGIRSDFEGKAAQLVTVAEGVERFLDYKKTRVGKTQHDDLRNRLKRFAADYGTHGMNEVTMEDLGDWLINLRNLRVARKPPLIGPRTRNHYRSTLSQLFSHGAKEGRGWCPRNPLADIENEIVPEHEIEAYTPEQVAKLMQTALDEMPHVLPALTLGMFSGLRVSEAPEIELSKVPLKVGEFRTASKKTGPRMSPVLEVTAAWLAAQKRRRGKAWTQGERKWNYAINELCERAKVKQIDNGARHSFISYRTAAIRDVAQVADECGNSPATIRKHYRKIVTSEEAERFFAIRPRTEAENVTKIHEGRASA